MKKGLSLTESDSQLMLLVKYFAHGILFSILGLVLGFVWAGVFLVLVLFGFIIGLIIGFVIFFLFMGWLNSIVTDIVWHIPIKTNWASVFFHGLVLSIAFIVVHVPSLIVNLAIPSTITVVLLLIVYAFVDGFIAKHIAGMWEEEAPPEMLGETPKAFFKPCINCGKDIPVASESCLYCGAEQKKKLE